MQKIVLFALFLIAPLFSIAQEATWATGPAGGLVIADSGKKTLTSTVTTTSTSYVDITGLSFDVVAGAYYQFKFYILWNTGLQGAGACFSVNGPTLTALGYSTSLATSNTAASGRYYAAYNSGTATASTPSNDEAIFSVLEGVITTSANGTVILRGLVETGGSLSVYANYSFVEWKRIR